MTIFNLSPPIDSTQAETMLDSLKAKLKIVGDFQNDVLLGWLSLSIDLVEKYTWRLLREYIVEGKFSDFRYSRILTTKEMLDFRRAPFNELISVTFSGSDGDELLEAYSAICSEFGEVYLKSEPNGNIREDEVYPIKVLANCGYKMVDGVWGCPDGIINAIIALSCFMYANPLDCGSSGCSSSKSSCNGIGLPPQVSLMLDTYVIRRYDSYIVEPVRRYNPNRWYNGSM
jgi:hypothetical protein